MTKLRLSNHRLAIETGRYVRPYKKPTERICPLCKKEAEDEKHFLVSCLGYQEKVAVRVLIYGIQNPNRENVDRKYTFGAIKPPK